MGVGSSAGEVQAAFQSLGCPTALFRCLGETVQWRTALGLAEAGKGLLPNGCRWRIGSLYAGAFDQLGRAALQTFPGAVYTYVAEACEKKRNALVWGRSPEYVASDAFDSALRALPVDVLCVTAPCVTVSKARRSKGAPDTVLAVGGAAVEGHLAAIRGAIMVHRPALLLLEQSDGLRTHHPGSYQQFNHGLRALGYDVYHCVHSSGVDDSCAHERVRLLWACRDRELL